MRKTLYSFLLLLMLTLTSKAVSAAEYVFVSLEFPPLEYAGKDGIPEGIAVSIVRRIMNTLGHTVDIKIHPWSRSLDLVRKGHVDAIFTAYRTPKRETFLDYSREILVPQTVSFYVRKGSQIEFYGDLNNLKGRRIGVVSTISYGPKFDQFRDQLNIQSVENIEQNFDKLLLGRIDLFISNKFVADWKLNTADSAKHIIRLPQEVEHVPSYIGFSKKRKLTDLRDAFDLELTKLKDSGEYAKLLEQYKITPH